jgi:hypothetical protein
VTFTATVSGSPPDGELVTFKNGSTTLGTGTLSGGSASLSTSALNAGSHSITASYGGDTTLASSSGSLAQLVNKAGTILQLTSSQNPSAVNQAVTFTAVVSSSGGTPGGTVTFKQGSTVLGTPTLDGNGQATVSTTFTSAGSYAITASYGGNANFKGSLASQTQVVQ